MMKSIIVGTLMLFTFNSFSQESNFLKYTNDKENVVASAIEGKWMPDSEMDNKISLVIFIKDTSILKKIPQKFDRFLSDKDVYFAGMLTFERDKKEYDFPCILIVLHGNPHMVFFRERNGDPLGDAESFNLFVARKEDRMNDILFIGGDFNNEPFTSYKRIE